MVNEVDSQLGGVASLPEDVQSEGATIEELVTELASFAAYFPKMS